MSIWFYFQGYFALTLSVCLGKIKFSAYPLCCLRSAFSLCCSSSCWSTKTKPKISANTTEPNSHYASPQNYVENSYPVAILKIWKIHPPTSKKRLFFQDWYCYALKRLFFIIIFFILKWLAFLLRFLLFVYFYRIQEELFFWWCILNRRIKCFL